MREKRKRILALDLLRGYFVSVIIIDHVAHFPGFFEFLTGRGLLWVSAAEGFFIISGLLVGYIYASKILTHTKATVKKIWRRAATLYLWSVSLTLLFTFWGNFVGHSAHIKTMIWEDGNIWALLYKTATLQYVYGWADFLAYYVVFMLLAPLALWLVAKHRGWLVVLVSVGWWYFRRTESIYDGWQVLFMSAIVAGYYLPQIEAAARRLSERARKRILVGLTATAVLALATSVLFCFGFWYMLGNARERQFISPGFTDVLRGMESWYAQRAPWFDKEALGPGRLLLASLCFPTFFIYFRRYEHKIEAVTRGFFRILGENSLLAYALQAILVFAIDLSFSKDIGHVWNAALNGGSVALVYWLCLQRRQMYLTVRHMVRKSSKTLVTAWSLPPRSVIDD